MQPYRPDELDLDPATMAAFLGQTAAGLAEVDRNIVSGSSHLNDNRERFEQVARQAMQTVSSNPARTPPRILPVDANQDHIIPSGSVPLIPLPADMTNVRPVVENRPYIDNGRNIPKIDNDPNQLEFNFDNSVTAISINNNIAELKKKVQSLTTSIAELDKKVQSLIHYFDEVENS
jgi:hypothetical protein